MESEGPVRLEAREIKEKEQFHDLSIFTSTMYPEHSDPAVDAENKLRSELALSTLANAGKLGIKCAVGDTNSRQEFLVALAKMDHVRVITLDQKLGMGQGRREALRLAREQFGTPFYLWTEPEKNNLITEVSIRKMVSGLREDSTDIVVPKRLNMSSLPPFQTKFENLANQRVKELTGNKEILDLWFGPKMFNEKGAEYFANYQGTLDKWDAIIKPVLEAQQAGLRVSSVLVNYQYPVKQTLAETGDARLEKKRADQYAQILTELGDEFWQNKLLQK